MKRLLPVLTALTSLLLATSDVHAAGFLCDKMPMYPTTGGWMHYAIVYNTGCVQQSVVGHVTMYSPPENCLTPGECEPLGDGTTTATMHGHLKVALKNAGELTNDMQCTEYLENNSHVPHADLYKEWNFTLKGIVPVTRTVAGNEETFHAVVFEVEFDDEDPMTGTVAYIGFELLGSPTPNLTRIDQSEAREAPGLTKIPGLVKVLFMDDDGEFNVAMIRVAGPRDDDDDGDDPAPDALQPTPGAFIPGGASDTPAAAYYSTSQSSSACRCWSHRQQRAHCHSRRLRCR